MTPRETSKNGDKVPDNIEYLTSSCNRVKLLRELVEASGKPEQLREGLGIPRSTFQRILSELQERNWAKKRDGAYTATELGEYVEEHFTDCVSEMSTLNRLERFFEHAPFSEVGVGVGVLSESEVILSSSTKPHAPTERMLSDLEEADEFYGVCPVVTNMHSKRFHEAILDSTYVENVVQGTVMDTILSRFDGRYEDVRGTDMTDTYVYEGEMPIGLGIMDGTVHVSAFDDDGIARALIVNETDEMLEWARGYHARYEEEADPVEEYLVETLGQEELEAV
jgi:predicted transcriptional regulator